MKVERCRSCKAEISFAITSKTGSRIPLDVTPGPDGNIAIVGRSGTGVPIAHIFRKADLELARDYGAVELFTTHLATCPNAAQWRQPRTKGAT
jgi:hypothetical protein